MAYLALYRAYRPQSFEDLAGQEHISTTLQNAIKENKIAHAYLFAGPRGTGKTTVAKIFAKAINCTGDTNNPPCNECDNCKAITKGEHPDVIEIDAASNNGVDEVRDLIEKVKYAPINGKYKVYIIDEVHMMSKGAFNALLKTLEEPPAHIVFILATTEPHKILPTIISRCQRFDFTRIEEKDIVKRMEYVLKEENKNYEKEALSIIAKLADGGMRDALSILEQCLAYNDEVTVENVNNVYGLLNIETKINFIKQLLSKDLEAVLKSLDLMLEGSVDIQRLTFDLIDILKDVIIYRNTDNVNVLSVLDKNNIELLSKYISVDECFEMVDRLVDASTYYPRTTDPKAYFELAILKICNKIKDDHKEVIVEEKVVETKKEVKEEVKEEAQNENTNIESLQEEEPLFEQEIIEEPSNTAPLEEVKETIDKPIDVDENDIMNILVQAQMTIRDEVQDKWQIINRYRFNMNTAKYANMLCNATVVAGSDKGLIITFEHQVEANVVNNTNNYYPLKRFLQEILGSEYDFIAVSEKKWPKIRKHFVELKHDNNLPSPTEIKLHHIGKEVVEKEEVDEAKEFAINMFGENIVKFENDD
ncbi:MAG: DNA polymerase III subunit gamma/tau [Thomasclavelia sp.]|nr:DNA polymerase III subunit gamma/tau [Thomasclavelia sp.]